MDTLRDKKAFISDMDGVIYHGNLLLPGVKEFFSWLVENGKEYLFLTNSSSRSPRELQEKMARLGLDIPEEHFHTSALATASFLAAQKPRGSAYVIGDAGLINALYDVGYTVNDVNPDYVVMGETVDYSYDKVLRAINLVRRGANLIGCNPDVSGPVEGGLAPGTGALISPVELATDRKAYFVGKPNPFMMRTALQKLGVRREDTVIIGDRMDTDIIAGLESMIDTVLVLSGVTSESEIDEYPDRPHYVLKGIGEIRGS